MQKFLITILILVALKFTASAQTTLTLKGLTEPHNGYDDFSVEVSNTEDRKIDISKDWQTHIILVDGKAYPVMFTAWWCMDSSAIAAGRSWSRNMSLNSYPEVSLTPGRHEIQMKLGKSVSNVLVITISEKRSRQNQKNPNKAIERTTVPAGLLA